jgi:hypothetical protein
MNRYASGAAAAVLLLSCDPADAQQSRTTTEPAYARTIRFPVYDPRLGSLAAYRRALIAAVDRHVASLEARGAVTELAGTEITVRRNPPRQAPLFEVRGALTPSVNANGALSGSVGTGLVDFPSSRRTPR